VGKPIRNGLTERWHGKVYINPPYSRKLLPRWTKKAFHEFKTGHCELVVLLLPLRNSKWFQFLWKRGAELRLADQRLRFTNQDENETCPLCEQKLPDNVAPFDSVVAILR